MMVIVDLLVMSGYVAPACDECACRHSDTVYTGIYRGHEYQP